MVDVAKNLQEVLGHLPEGVELVAISKYHPNEYILPAYEAGQRIFGESHEQELRQKVETLPKDIQWHFIGHLQTNKVKYIAPYISMVERSIRPSCSARSTSRRPSTTASSTSCSNSISPRRRRSMD